MLGVGRILAISPGTLSGEGVDETSIESPHSDSDLPGEPCQVLASRLSHSFLRHINLSSQSPTCDNVREKIMQPRFLSTFAPAHTCYGSWPCSPYLSLSSPSFPLAVDAPKPKHPFHTNKNKPYGRIDRRPSPAVGTTMTTTTTNSRIDHT